MPQAQPSDNVSLKQRNHDLYLAQKRRVAFVSFPRSGSNWACSMLTAMLKDSVLTGKTLKLTGRSGHGLCPIDSPTISYESMLSKDNFSGIVKTHAHVWDADTYVIYMFRDARETLASFRHWHRSNCPGKELNTWTDDQYIHVFLGQLLTAWWKAVRFGLRYPRNIVFVRYKDLLENPALPMQQMADFLGVAVPPHQLTKIFQDHTLDKMKAQKPGLVYRGVKTNQGRGDFPKRLLFLITLRSFLPYRLLCIFSRRRCKFGNSDRTVSRV